MVKEGDVFPREQVPWVEIMVKPGKNVKGYVEPMGEGYDKPDEKLKTDRKMFSIGQKERDAKERLLAIIKAKREEQ